MKYRSRDRPKISLQLEDIMQFLGNCGLPKNKKEKENIHYSFSCEMTQALFNTEYSTLTVKRVGQ